MKSLLPRDPWTVAALVCLFGGAVLLVVAWYDISGSANVYEQMPYLVSAGFSGLALIIVGSALVAAGRADRVERRLAQLVNAVTTAAEPTEPAEPTAPSTPTPVQEPDAQSPVGVLVAAGGRTYHRPGCLLVRDTSPAPVTAAEIAASALTPCPVCDPERPSETP